MAEAVCQEAIARTVITVVQTTFTTTRQKLAKPVH